MKIKQIDKDVYAGAFMLIFSSYFFYVATKMRAAASRFPKIIVSVIILLSIGCMIQGVLKSKLNVRNGSEATAQVYWDEIKIPLLVFGMITLYVITLQYIGFITSTFIFIPALMLFYQNRNKLLIGCCTVFTIAFIYTLFTLVLKLRLP